LWEYKTSDTEKISIFFGGLNLVNSLSEADESLTVKEEHSVAESDFVKNMKKQDEEFDIYAKELKELRSKIVENLNKNGEIKEIDDLFEKDPPADLLEINPIMFVLHLPSSLQEISHQHDESTNVEDFFVVCDGEIMIIATVCKMNEFPSGVLDARNRIYSLLHSIVPSTRLIAPCIAPGGLVFIEKNESIPEAMLNQYVIIEHGSNETIADTLYDLYMDLSFELKNFFEASDLRSSIFKIGIAIRENESEILSNLNKFLRMGWKDFLKRRKLAETLKQQSAEILSNLSKYTSNCIELSEKANEIRDSRLENKLFDETYEKLGFDHYIQPFALNTDSLVRILEHTRNETSEYSTSTATIVSAIGGAVIGSVLTILFSYLIGVL
jgi:hypothetical protein